MRAPILGACLGREPSLLIRYVQACTRITHTDPRAEQGALAIALGTWHGLSSGPGGLDPEAVVAASRPHMHDEALASALELIPRHLVSGNTPADFAEALGLGNGVTGFINHTVPVALYCWLRYPSSFEEAVRSVILLGGDTDTTAAIVGGLAGATVGQQGIPQPWLDGVVDYPRSVRWIRRLGLRLAQQLPATGPPVLALGPLPLFWPAVILRNLVFTLIVLGHGFRRLLPPY